MKFRKTVKGEFWVGGESERFKSWALLLKVESLACAPIEGVKHL
jgi:hypothetical protein